MSLSNLDKKTITNLFQMININDTDRFVETIKNDYITFSKVKLISSQIKHLQNEANSILKEHNFNYEISNMKCSFKKTPGSLYYLYEKDDKYLSLIPPNEWWGNPGNFICKVYYDYDLSFYKI
jgi:hypothetical protein